MIIIYGGSFNPPTIAHDQIIRLINEKLKPNKIILVPSSDGYYKDGLISFENRLSMLEILASKYKFPYEISLAEKDDKFNGTIELLNHFSKHYEDIWFVVGSDHLNLFHTWINYEKLLLNYKFIIITRPNHPIDLTYLTKYKTQYKILELNIDISSSEVRNDYESYKNYLPEGIYEYIMNNNLYERKKE